MREQGFLNGKPHGPCKVYDQRGRLVQEMTYREGRLHGTMTIYDSGGNVAKSMEYEDGRVKKDLPPAMKDEPRPASVPGMDRKR